MAEPISIQQLKDASEDAISLADFIYKPANVMIPRRLAADINSLQYYLDYMSSYAQHSYETYDEMVANAPNLPNGVSAFVTNDLDTAKNGIYTYNGVSFVKGDYQPEKAAKDYVDAKLGGLEVFDGKVRAQDVSTLDGSTQDVKNTEFRNELDALPFEGGVLADTFVTVEEQITGEGALSLRDFNSRAVLTVNSIAELLQVKATSGRAVFVKGLQGGTFIYDSTKSTINDGGVIFSGWVRQIYDGVISPVMFGLIDGEDNTEVIRNTLNYAATSSTTDLVKFPPTKSILSSSIEAITYKDNFQIDFGAHEFICNTSMYSAFLFGDRTNIAVGAVPRNKGLRVSGGIWDNTTPSAGSFIAVYDTASPVINNMHMKRVGNGGLLIGATCTDFFISDIDADHITPEGVSRSIWILGSEVVGFSSNIVDKSTFTLISTNPDTIVRGRVTKCNLRNQEYGVYLINARDIVIDNCIVTLDPIKGERCIAVNNYSLGVSINRNTFYSSKPSTGVLVGDGSTAIIKDNNFRGSYASGADISIQYLGDAVILNNTFNTDTTRKIHINSGGSALLKSNTFTRPSGFNASTTVVQYHSINPANTGDGGNAEKSGNVTFTDNFIYHDGVGVQVQQNASLNGNYMGADLITVSHNTFFNRNLANAEAGQAALVLALNSDEKPIHYSMYGQTILPLGGSALQSEPKLVNSSKGVFYRKELASAVFMVNSVDGIQTVERLSGDLFSLSAHKVASGNIVLTPRSGAGQAGADVSTITSIISGSSSVASIQAVSIGSSSEFKLLSASGDALDIATVQVKIIVTLTSIRRE